MRKMFVALVLLHLPLGCSSKTDEAASTAERTRSVQGRLELSSYDVDNPVILAQSSRGRSFVASIRGDGSFSVSVLSGDSYQLLIANTRRDGHYEVISDVSWEPGGASRWAKIEPGAAVDVGTIRPARGRGPSVTVQSASCGCPDDRAEAPNREDAKPESRDDDDDDKDEGSHKGSVRTCQHEDDANGGRRKCDHDDCEEVGKEKAGAKVCSCKEVKRKKSECDRRGDVKPEGRERADGDDIARKRKSEREQEADKPCASAPPNVDGTPSPTGGGSGAGGSSPGTGTRDAGCVVNADCQAGFRCLASVCQ